MEMREIRIPKAAFDAELTPIFRSVSKQNELPPVCVRAEMGFIVIRTRTLPEMDADTQGP